MARWVVDGLINGLHRAPHFGASIDFAEHRGYVAGDDIRRVDWRLFARTDRYYIKQYEADTNSNFTVLHGRVAVDGLREPGRSRSSSTDRISAACLAYLSHKQRDRVGIITFDDDIVTHVPPSAKHFNVLLHTLDRAKAGAAGPAARGLDEDRRALQAPEHRRADLGSLREPDRSARGAQAVPRSSATTSSCFTCSIRPRSSFRTPRRRASRISRAARKCRWCPKSFAEQYRKMMQEHIEAITTKCLRGADRLRAAQHLETARRGALQRTSATASG